MTHKHKAKANGKKAARKPGQGPAARAEDRARNRAGKAITTAMRKKGYTITTLAEGLKCEASTISRYCAGLRFPEPPMLRALCKKLDLDANALL